MTKDEHVSGEALSQKRFEEEIRKHAKEPFDRKSFTKKLEEPYAKLAHQIWSEFIDYCLRIGAANGPEFQRKSIWERWHNLARTPYELLSEKEKESDRFIAQRYSDVVLGVVAKTEAERQKQLFTLCDFCNKEFEITFDNTNISAFQQCPHCQRYNKRWLRLGKSLLSEGSFAKESSMEAQQP